MRTIEQQHAGRGKQSGCGRLLYLTDTATRLIAKNSVGGAIAACRLGDALFTKNARSYRQYRVAQQCGIAETHLQTGHIAMSSLAAHDVVSITSEPLQFGNQERRLAQSTATSRAEVHIVTGGGMVTKPVAATERHAQASATADVQPIPLSTG